MAKVDKFSRGGAMSDATALFTGAMLFIRLVIHLTAWQVLTENGMPWYGIAFLSVEFVNGLSILIGRGPLPGFGPIQWNNDPSQNQRSGDGAEARQKQDP